MHKHATNQRNVVRDLTHYTQTHKCVLSPAKHILNPHNKKMMFAKCIAIFLQFEFPQQSQLPLRNLATPTFKLHLQQLVLVVDDVAVGVEGVTGTVHADLQAQVGSCRSGRRRVGWGGVISNDPLIRIKGIKRRAPPHLGSSATRAPSRSRRRRPTLETLWSPRSWPRCSAAS